MRKESKTNHLDSTLPTEIVALKGSQRRPRMSLLLTETLRLLAYVKETFNNNDNNNNNDNDNCFNEEQCFAWHFAWSFGIDFNSLILHFLSNMITLIDIAIWAAWCRNRFQLVLYVSEWIASSFKGLSQFNWTQESCHEVSQFKLFFSVF